MGDAGDPRSKPSRPRGLELSPISGLAFGLAVSTALWAGVVCVAHLVGVF